MESQLQHTHGRHYDDQDPITAVGHHNEDEHHGEKKSVIKKVKEKAKKLKDTITKHGHGGHDHHHHDYEDDDDDDETVEDPEVHGAPMYDSAKVGQGGPEAILALPRGNLERPSLTAEDRYSKPVTVTSHGTPPPVSTGVYGTRLPEPTGLGHHQGYGHEANPENWPSHGTPQPVSGAVYGMGLSEPTGQGHNQGYGQEVNPENWRGSIGHSTGVTDPIHGPGHVQDHVVNRGVGKDVNQGGMRGIIGKSTGMVPDPDAPKDPSLSSSDPSNYATKVDNPSRKGGKEAELRQLQHSFDKMGIDSEPKTLDHNHPENLPRETLTGNPASQTSTYASKISSSASAIADKAAAAKDAVASKLGYSGQSQTSVAPESTTVMGSATEYAHTITEKVTETLAPVYGKVVDAGSSVISKVQGSVSGSGHPDSPLVADKGVSVKEHLMETMRPGDDDKALSEVITHALHRGNDESEKKSGEDRPMGIVTESVEVRQRLGTDRRDEEKDSGNVAADKGVGDRLKDAVGSWFGGKGDAPQGTLGTSYVTDEGLSSNPAGDRKRGTGPEP